jgi:hypothetical protein
MEGVLGRRCFSLGRFYQGEAVGGDVTDSWMRKQGHGIGAGKITSSSRHHRLAAKSACVWKTGFYFPKAQVGNLRGWMFLAWMSQARDETSE